jgi:hypothetical protein
MKLSELERAYEVARAWTLSPVSYPPLGWAQLVCSGVAAWMREIHPLMTSPEATPEPAHVAGCPLLTVVATMIAEVCQ